MNNQHPLVIGVDYGTDSVRASLIDTAGGEERAACVVNYPRWTEGLYCDPGKNRFRQHPLDYTEGLEAAVKGALKKLPKSAAERIAAIGIDTTGSTPCAVDEAGTPLALLDGYEENPNAMFVLWKDHTAVEEAELISTTARSWGGADFTKYEGGVYSSEWFWSKLLHILREDAGIRRAAFSWVEHCDWMPALLTGTTDPLWMKRSRCAAGHKAMWHSEWNGLPPEEFLVKIDPLLKGLRSRLYSETHTSDKKAGGLTREWAARLGLREGTAVAVGAFDAHMGSVGGGITDGTLVKIMGTSSCDMLVAQDKTLSGKSVAGICGQVDGSIMPEMIGLEAGQSAFGDIYAWFKDLLSWPLEAALPKTVSAKVRREAEERIIPLLSAQAEEIDPAQSTLIALDWLNGRRTPFADQALKGAIAGLTLGSSAPRVFRALVEATAFGSRAIVEQFRKEGISVSEVIALGGIARKNDFVMQVTADVLDMPIKVAAADQAVALGAAMFGAVAGGVFPAISDAQKAMGRGFDKTYAPNKKHAIFYGKRYEDYVSLGTKLEGLLRKL